MKWMWKLVFHRKKLTKESKAAPLVTRAHLLPLWSLHHPLPIPRSKLRYPSRKRPEKLHKYSNSSNKGTNTSHQQGLRIILFWGSYNIIHGFVSLSCRCSKNIESISLILCIDIKDKKIWWRSNPEFKVLGVIVLPYSPCVNT